MLQKVLRRLDEAMHLRPDVQRRPAQQLEFAVDHRSEILLPQVEQVPSPLLVRGVSVPIVQPQQLVAQVEEGGVVQRAAVVDLPAVVVAGGEVGEDAVGGDEFLLVEV